MKSTVSHSRALIVADRSILSKRLKKEIELLGCDTHIYSKLRRGSTKRNSSIYRRKLLSSKYNYLFVLDLDPDRFRYLNISKKLLSTNSYKKIVIVLPYLQTNNKAFLTNSFLEEIKNLNTKVLFVGVVLSDDPKDLDNNFFYKGKYLLSNINQEMYFSDISGTVKFIIENTFSFSTSEYSAYISDPYSTSDLIKKFEQNQTKNYLCQDLMAAKVKEISISNISEISLMNYVRASVPTFEISNTKSIPTEITHDELKSKIFIENNLIKKSLKFAFTFILVFVLLPAALFALSFFITKFNVRNEGNNQSTIKYARIFGSHVSRLNKNVFELYGKIPLIEIVVNDTYQSSLLFYSINNIYAKDSSTINLAEILFSSVLGNSVKNPEPIISSLQSELDFKYSSLEYLKGDIKSSANEYGLSENELDYLLTMDSKKVLNTKDFLSNLTLLLGEESQTDYFILVQNEDNINSGGGEIVASAYLSFDKGRLSNFVTYSINEINQQTKGLRNNSNVLESGGLIPNFSNANTSVEVSKNVENVLWYLDNSLDIHPEGILFINKKILTRILDIGGNESMLVGANTDYDSVLNEAFNSIKSKETQKYKLLDILSTGFRNKDIYLYFTDQRIQDKFSSLDYSNNEIANNCTNCNGQNILVLETKLSGETLSSELSRRADIEVNFQEQVVKNKLIFEYDLPLGESQEIYFQLVVDKNSSFAPIKTLVSEKKSLIKPSTYSTNSYKVAGIPIRLENKTVVEIVWESPQKETEARDNYTLKWIGQPGIESYPVKFVVDGENVEDLTNRTNDSYNTDSSSDVEIELKDKWTK